MQRYLKIAVRKIDIKNSSIIDNSRRILIRYDCALNRILIINIAKGRKIFEINLKD
jgi:hypothetical protein